ncbi:hypothetical protein MASR1M90_11480 [Desulfovibrionales bacterium]
MIMVEVAINQPCCSGCQACVEMAPEIFAFDAQAGVAVVLASPCPHETARTAAAYCPDDCIDIIEKI